MKRFTTNARVRYAETDAAGIAYYGSYFIYFELGRIELFRELGLTYNKYLPIAETYCRYHASARFDDRLEIVSHVAQLRSKGFRIGCEVYRLDDNDRTLLVEGYTAMVTVDEQNNPIALPERFQSAFSACQ